MKQLLVVLVCGLVLVGGCKRKAAPDSDKESSSSAESQEPAKQKEVEMLLPAQKHVGLVVAPAAVVQLSEYFGPPAQCSRSTITSGKLLPSRAEEC